MPFVIWKRTINEVHSASAPHTYDTTPFAGIEHRAHSLSRKHLDFDAFMDELEADPLNNDSIESADNWIAKTFYDGNIESMRSLRQKKQISQAVLARIVGTSQPQIARIESGRSDPQLSTILKLTEALSVDANVMCAALGQTIVKKVWRSK